MAVGPQGVALAPDHDAQLGVGLVLHEAEDDVHARPLHGPGPTQVRLFVKAGLDLDHGGDVLAVLGRLDQGGDDGAVLGGAVQGLFDGDDVRVTRRLPQELHHHVEAFERVVDQHVLFTDGREHIAAVVAHPFGIAGLIAGKFKVGVAAADQFRHLGQAKHAVDHHHILGLGVQFARDEVAQIVGHGGLDLDPYHRAHAALLERLLKLHDEVLGLLLDLDVGVPNQTEGAALQHVTAGEQVVDEEHQQALQRHIAGAALGRAAVGRQRPESLHLGRDRDQRVQGPVVPPPLELQRQRKAEIGQEGEGVGRIDGHRRQDGEQLVQELRLQTLALGLGGAAGVDHLDTGVGQLHLQLAPPLLLMGHQLAGGFIDPLQCLAGGQAIGRQHPHALAYLTLEASDPGHEELIQIISRDRQEAQALQQGMGRV